MIKFIINGNPISSKNSIRSGITKNGRNYTYVKKDVKDYRDNALLQLRKQIKCGWYLDWDEIHSNLDVNHKFPISNYIQTTFIFYCKDNRKRDLCNLIQCPADLLQQAGIILNDYLIVSLDGSRIMPPDKDNPRTEIIIYKLNEIQNTY